MRHALFIGTFSLWTAMTVTGINVVKSDLYQHEQMPRAHLMWNKGEG